MAAKKTTNEQVVLNDYESVIIFTATLDAIAASSSPLLTNSAAADVEFVGTTSACG